MQTRDVDGQSKLIFCGFIFLKVKPDFLLLVAWFVCRFLLLFFVLHF